MLVDLSIVPLNGNEHTSDEIARALSIIEASGVRYELTPAGTCLEGSWEEVMPVIERCHREVRKHAPHVVTLIKIEDDEGSSNKLSDNVESVRRKMADCASAATAQPGGVYGKMQGA
jgi:uncharacterized protein (TIGR00106 family)